jgi:hypothetical protein
MTPSELDQRLRAALDVEPSAELVARLEHFWRQRSQAERRRRRGWQTVAVAAAALVAVTAAIWLIGSRRDKSAVADRPDNASPRADESESQPALVADSAAAPDPVVASSAGRPATEYERLMFLVQTRAADADERNAAKAAAAAAIDRIVADADADAGQVIASAGVEVGHMETALLAELPRAGADMQPAIAVLLGACGSERALPALVKLAERPTALAAALSSMEQVAGLPVLGALALQTNHPTVRAALMNRLLTADSEPAIRAYLMLVNNAASRDEALAAADAAERFPMAALVRLLDDDDRQSRVAAAMVLGYVNGPSVSRALIDRVLQAGGASVEAWAALLACRGESADQFLAQASRQPRLLGHVNSARMYWARMAP